MTTPAEHFQSGIKKPRGRGKAQKSMDLISTARAFLEEANPTTVRGVCYHLFVHKVIPSMEKKHTQRVSRLLKDAREEGWIPWEWIADETRELEQVPSWGDPEAFVRVVRRSYRRDFWAYQPARVEVWGEKGTVRGILTPILEEYGVGFRVMHGFGSATSVHEVAVDDDDLLTVLYVGDWDPSGLYMSDQDLPERLERYGGTHISIRRVALLPDDLEELPPFHATEKRKDPRYKWFVERYGQRCWELDAMHPNTLRDRVTQAIKAEIEPEAWARCVRTQEAEQESLKSLLDDWKAE